MPAPILTTRFYIPPPRANTVLRSRLTERLNQGLHRKLTLISAPAGFGKTTLVGEWVDNLRLATVSKSQTVYRIAWLSLDEGDNDSAQFLTYFLAALDRIGGIEATFGEGALNMLQSPQPPPAKAVLASLMNHISTVTTKVILVLDDYHKIEAQPIHAALTFLLDHLPPQMHLVIATREDPDLPLARLRAQDQLTELRAAELRFTLSEAADFLNKVMRLDLSADDIAALETRTEGWIAGLQLAAISMQGHQDITSFIESFTGSHHFVMDYLVEEVLGQQSESVQSFLLRTSILDRMCGPLCDAVLRNPAASGQETLEYLERTNLFLVPLDDERRWYRYHHLFADLLKQRLYQSADPSSGDEGGGVAEYHRRASIWYEENGLEIEAFHHAVAAHDVDRAARLVEGNGMPLVFRGVLTPVLNWLESLPSTTLDGRPTLWVIYASALLLVSQLNNVEAKLHAAETALHNTEQDAKTNDLIGQIAAIRAMSAVGQNQVETIISQSRRALEYLHPGNLPVRTSAKFTLGYAYQLQGNRAAARQAYTESLSISQKIGQKVTALLASGALANIEEADNHLHLAEEMYRRYLKTLGEPSLPVASEGHLGLVRIYYEWNELEIAERHAQQSIQLARQMENTDRFIVSEMWLARVKLVQGDSTIASSLLERANRSESPHSFWLRAPETIAVQTLILIRQGNLAEAMRLAQTHNLPLCEAQAHLAQGDATAALVASEAAYQQAEAKGWADELLNAMVLQATAMYMQGERDEALRRMDEALALAEPEGFIRLFVDKGRPMAQLLAEVATEGMMPNYIGKLLAAFDVEAQKVKDKSSLPPVRPLFEPLSQRELEVLQLIAQGLSNHEISERLFLALSTVKGHNQNIFGKLQVQRRTEAVARARELGLL